MHLARVIGKVVATQKHEALEGVKLLILQPVNHDMKPKSAPIVAVDNMQSGEGDLVAYVTGREGSLMLERNFTPVDAGIVAIVDSVNTEVAP